jgi:hypothetical protein
MGAPSVRNGLALLCGKHASESIKVAGSTGLKYNIIKSLPQASDGKTAPAVTVCCSIPSDIPNLRTVINRVGAQLDQRAYFAAGELNYVIAPLHPKSSAVSRPDRIRLTVSMACLNEERTVGVCVEKTFKAFRAMGVVGQVVVADNGSGDRSVELASTLGARSYTSQRRDMAPLSWRVSKRRAAITCA